MQKSSATLQIQHCGKAAIFCTNARRGRTAAENDCNDAELALTHGEMRDESAAASGIAGEHARNKPAMALIEPPCRRTA